MESPEVVVPCYTSSIFPAFRPRRGLTYSTGAGRWVMCRNVAVFRNTDGAQDAAPSVATAPFLAVNGAVAKNLLLTEAVILDTHQAFFPEELFVMNISRKGLNGYKGSFDKFVNVTKILADDNELNMDAFSSFPSLQYLDISSNSIRHISRDISYCFERLQTLNLSFNMISLESVTVLGHLSSVKCLHLTGNSLKSLPGGLFNGDQFTELETLYLDKNCLQGEIVFLILSSFPKLKHLNLSDNRLQAVPYLVMDRKENSKTMEAEDSEGKAGGGTFFSDIRSDDYAVCIKSRSCISPHQQIDSDSKQKGSSFSCRTENETCDSNTMIRQQQFVDSGRDIAAPAADSLLSTISAGEEDSAAAAAATIDAGLEDCSSAGRATAADSRVNKTAQLDTRSSLHLETASSRVLDPGQSETVVQRRKSVKSTDKFDVSHDLQSSHLAAKSVTDFTCSADVNLGGSIFTNLGSNSQINSEASLGGTGTTSLTDTSIANTNYQSTRYPAANIQENSVSGSQTPEIGVSTTSETCFPSAENKNRPGNTASVQVRGNGSQVVQNNDSDSCINNQSGNEHCKFRLQDGRHSVRLDYRANTHFPFWEAHDDAQLATRQKQDSSKKHADDGIKPAPASCYFVSHAPFPELISLCLANTAVSSEEALLSLGGWPSLRSVDITGTPLVTRHTHEPPLLREYLQVRCGVTIRRQNQDNIQVIKRSQIPKNLRKVSSGGAHAEIEALTKVSKNKNDKLWPVVRLECQSGNVTSAEAKRYFTPRITHGTYPSNTKSAKQRGKSLSGKEVKVRTSARYNTTENATQGDVKTGYSDTPDDTQYGWHEICEDSQNVEIYDGRVNGNAENDLSKHSLENDSITGPDMLEDTQSDSLKADEKNERGSCTSQISGRDTEEELQLDSDLFADLTGDTRVVDPPEKRQVSSSSEISCSVGKNSNVSPSQRKVYLTEVNEKVYAAEEPGCQQSRGQTAGPSLPNKKVPSHGLGTNDPYLYMKSSIRGNTTALKHMLEHPVLFSTERFTIERLKKMYENEEVKQRTASPIQRRRSAGRRTSAVSDLPGYITNNVQEIRLEDALQRPPENKDYRDATRLMARLQRRFARKSPRASQSPRSGGEKTAETPRSERDKRPRSFYCNL